MNRSAMVPPDIVGVWTLEGRREQEPGHHLVLHLWIAVNQVSSNRKQCQDRLCFLVEFVFSKLLYNPFYEL